MHVPSRPRSLTARAFTLIELIVVIVIVGVLVALASVAYNSIVSNSKKSAVESSAHQVAKTIASEGARTQAPLTDAERVAAALQEFPASGAVKVTDESPATEGELTVTRDGYKAMLSFSGGESLPSVGQAMAVSAGPAAPAPQALYAGYDSMMGTLNVGVNSSPTFDGGNGVMCDLYVNNAPVGGCDATPVGGGKYRFTGAPIVMGSYTVGQTVTLKMVANDMMTMDPLATLGPITVTLTN